MKIFVFESGSCRGEQFGGRYTITIKDIEKLAAFGDDEEAIEDFVQEFENYGEAFQGLLQLVLEEEELTFEEVIATLKNKEYIGVMREESSVGYGQTKTLAKEGYMSCECDMDDDWDE